MLSVPGIEFLFFVFFLSAFFFLLKPLLIRQGVLALLSAFFLQDLIVNRSTWAALIAFVLAGYVAAALLRARPGRVALGVCLAVLVAVFLILKKYEFLAIVLPQSWLSHWVYVIGLSYMLFRQIHFIVHAAQGQISRLSLWTYLNYQLNIFVIIAGPIQRYEHFRAQWEELRPVLQDRHELLSAYLRIFVGVLQVILLGVFCKDQYRDALAHPEWSRLARVSVVFYAYPAFVYFNFAGYCNVVIGASSLFGIRIPENFDHPYCARNMIEFWNRWHITLSHWLRDYLFNPLYKILAQTWPNLASAWVTACFFVVFLVAGIWHGSTLNFVVFGLMHGLGVSAAKMWENHLLRRRGNNGLKKYLASKKTKVIAVVLTFHFACATFLFFPGDLDYCLAVINALATSMPVP